MCCQNPCKDIVCTVFLQATSLEAPKKCHLPKINLISHLSLHSPVYCLLFAASSLDQSPHFGTGKKQAFVWDWICPYDKDQEYTIAMYFGSSILMGSCSMFLLTSLFSLPKRCLSPFSCYRPSSTKSPFSCCRPLSDSASPFPLPPVVCLSCLNHVLAPLQQAHH